MISTYIRPVNIDDAERCNDRRTSWEVWVQLGLTIENGVYVEVEIAKVLQNSRELVLNCRRRILPIQVPSGAPVHQAGIKMV